MVLMIFYGRAADRVGRKPILVFSLTGIGVATAGFGMSQTLGEMVAWRCAAGVFAGSVVTVRTMISEQTTKESQGRAFGWYMFVRQLGIFIGPLIGMSTAIVSRLNRGYMLLILCRRRSSQPSTAIPKRLRRRRVLGEIPLRPFQLRGGRSRALLRHHDLLLRRRDAQTQSRWPI